MQEFKSLIHTMTDTAGQIARQYYRSGFDVDHKSDDSPVTIADRTIESRLREIIETQRPEDGFLGEEHGRKDSQNGLLWVVDPIDGTKSFIAGRPSFGTLIGLWEGDTPLLGAIYQPITNELWLGLKDEETTLNNKKITTNKNPRPDKLKIASTSPAQFSENPALLSALREKADFFVWGGDCYLYGMLAFGGVDVVIESGLAPHDYAAVPSVVNGAAGHTCDWQGRPMTLSSRGDILCTADMKTRDQVLEIIQGHSL